MIGRGFLLIGVGRTLIRRDLTRGRLFATAARPKTQEDYTNSEGWENVKKSLEPSRMEPRGKGGQKKQWSRALKWTPIPIIALFSYNELRRLKDPDQPLRRWELSCYRMLPLKTLSRAWGYINNFELPVWARTPFLTWYANTFGCAVCEAEVEDLTEYRNLGEFFRRALKPGLRPICPDASLVSPADGTVLVSGRVANGMVEQVKGVSYSLQAFFGPNMWTPTQRFIVADEEYEKSLLRDPENNTLYTSVIYLAPGDYHRFHSPADWRITDRRHFAGELLSVSPRMAKWITGLFTLNERAVYLGEWEHGFFSMTAVGATNVGSIRVYDDPELSTNSWMTTKHTWRDKKMDLKIRKGDLFGEFNLGSTIVLLFEAPKDQRVDPMLTSLRKVQMGERILSNTYQEPLKSNRSQS